LTDHRDRLIMQPIEVFIDHESGISST